MRVNLYLCVCACMNFKYICMCVYRRYESIKICEQTWEHVNRYTQTHVCNSIPAHGINLNNQLHLAGI